jgi:hypothetical protein
MRPARCVDGVADHSGLFATIAATALFGCASNELFGSRQLRWQLLPARMLARRFKRQLQLFPLALVLDFGPADSRLWFQQFQLCLRELFAAWPVLLDPYRRM